MGYLKAAIKGFSWMGGLRIIIRFIGFLKIVILARLLSPIQFGVYGISTLALAFLETFTESGINVFLIQHEDNIDDYISTAWIVSILRGLIISLLIILAAPLIVKFFKSSEAYQLLILISLVPAIRGFINPSVVKFQKQLQFNKEFWLRGVLTATEALVSVILVFITRSTVGLIISLIVTAMLEVILSFSLLCPRPRLSFNPGYFKTIVHSGKWMTVAGIFNYLFHQGDDIVVGRLLSPAFLGLYQQAYKISTLPISEVADTFGKVTFPIYTKISGNKIRLRQAFKNVTLGISALTIPLGAVLFFFPEAVISFILGDNWLAAAPALRVLSIFGVVRAISGSASALFLSVKKQQYVSVITFVSILGLAITIIPLVSSFGIFGAGLSALIGSIIALPVINYYLVKVLR